MQTVHEKRLKKALTRGRDLVNVFFEVKLATSKIRVLARSKGDEGDVRTANATNCLLNLQRSD